MAIPCNVGGLDKTLRTVLGILLVAIGFFMDLSATWTIVAYVGAIIALLTALLNYCPLNQLFDIDTCAQAQAR